MQWLKAVKICMISLKFYNKSGQCVTWQGNYFPVPRKGLWFVRAAGRRGGWRQCGERRAVEPGGRTQLCTPGLGLAASRFSPWLLEPRGIQLLEAEGSLRRSARAPFSILRRSLGWNCWSSPVARPESRGSVCPGPSDWSAGIWHRKATALASCRVGSGTSVPVDEFVCGYFKPGTWTLLFWSARFSLVLSPQGADGTRSLCSSGP